MNITIRGNALAIALGGLAVAIAATGTAVAVAASQVNIVDAATSKAARVDVQGRLSTTEPTATIRNANLLFNVGGQDNFVTSPTLATLAITKLDFSNPSINASATSAEVRVYAYQADLGTGATDCSPVTAYHQLATYNVAPGDDVVNNLSTPLVVSKHGTSKYCITLYVTTLGGPYSASYLPGYSFNAYVVSGNYQGLGASAEPATLPPARSARGDR